MQKFTDNIMFPNAFKNSHPMDLKDHTFSSFGERLAFDILRLIISSSPPSSPSALSISMDAHHQNHLNITDKEHFQLGKSSAITCSSSSNKTTEDDNESIYAKDKRACARQADLLAFYTRKATDELQNIKNSDLQCLRMLASGGYGTVYYGKWKGSGVAIKKLKSSHISEDPTDDNKVLGFWREACFLSMLHHPNVVSFYGVVTEIPMSNFAIATEFMADGSLNDVLQRKERIIDNRQRLIIAMDAAFGMEYLHENNFVHFDLKSHNLLVNMRDPLHPVCKIGDLGLARIKKGASVSGGRRGTLQWMAPELLNNKDIVDEKVDVYSFGIVMWEMLTRDEPHAYIKRDDIIAGVVEGTLRPEIPSWCDPPWKDLMQQCWSSDPNARPSFSEIANELQIIAAFEGIDF